MQCPPDGDKARFGGGGSLPSRHAGEMPGGVFNIVGIDRAVQLELLSRRPGSVGHSRARYPSMPILRGGVRIGLIEFIEVRMLP